MLKIFGFALFASMVVIYSICFAGLENKPPISIVVIILGVIGSGLIRLGYRMERNNPPIKKTLYPHRISNQAPDDFGFHTDSSSEDSQGEDSSSENSSSKELESFTPEPLDPETEIEISKLPTPK